MVSSADLLRAVPSGATGLDDPDYRYTALDNGVYLKGFSGDLGEDVEDQKLRGIWAATGLELSTRAGEEDFRVDRDETRWSIGITDNRLLLSVTTGPTPLGNLSMSEGRRLLAFSWNFDDIATIYVGRVKKYTKWWNEEVLVSTTDDTGRLRLTSVGPHAGSSAKSLVHSLISTSNAVDNSFVEAFGSAAAQRRTGMEPNWQIQTSRSEGSRTITFS